MKLVTVKKTGKQINRFFDWAIHMIGYALILITTAVVFSETLYIDSSYYGLWGLIAAVIIYILNKTIKPIIVWMTLPITGLTLGLFYPFINVIILKIVSFILGNHFILEGIFIAFILSVFISIMNILMDELILKPLLEKEK